MRMLQNCYQNPVILLLDEYDAPAAKASNHGYDDRMYAKEYEEEYDEIFCYGISFYKKRCLVSRA